jgi:hypothetical protein
LSPPHWKPNTTSRRCHFASSCTVPKQQIHSLVISRSVVRFLVPAPNKTKAYGSFAGPFSFGAANGLAVALETSVIRSQLQVGWPGKLRYFRQITVKARHRLRMTDLLFHSKRRSGFKPTEMATIQKARRGKLSPKADSTRAANLARTRLVISSSSRNLLR